MRALSTPLIANRAADNLILHAIIEHAANNLTSEMAFFTLNASDFSNVALELQKVNVALLTDSAAVLSWLQT